MWQCMIVQIEICNFNIELQNSMQEKRHVLCCPIDDEFSSFCRDVENEYREWGMSCGRCMLQKHTSLCCCTCIEMVFINI